MPTHHKIFKSKTSKDTPFNVRSPVANILVSKINERPQAILSNIPIDWLWAIKRNIRWHSVAVFFIYLHDPWFFSIYICLHTFTYLYLSPFPLYCFGYIDSNEKCKECIKWDILLIGLFFLLSTILSRLRHISNRYFGITNKLMRIRNTYIYHIYNENYWSSPFLSHLTPRQFPRRSYAVGYPLLLLTLSLQCPIILGINYLQTPRVQCPWQWQSQCQPRSPSRRVDVPIPGLGPLELFQPQTRTALWF